jgi:hypothetical protein
VRIDPATGVHVSSSRVKLAGVDHRLLDYARRNGLVVTAGTNGKHNVGSKHYQGHAIDFRSRGLEEEFVGHLERDAKQHGLILRDERTRPPGQKVWSGGHFHCEVS